MLVAVIRWVARLIACVLLLQVGWWLIMATSLPWTPADGLTPVTPLGLGILLNLILVVVFLSLGREPSDSAEEPA